MRRTLLILAAVTFIANLICFIPLTTTFGSHPTNLPTYNVKDFGVVGDGATMNTDAIHRTIDKADRDGGGVVYFPPGDYVTGTIQIGDNVTLYLEAGVTIRGSKNREDYLHESLIYAENSVNVSIRGRGTIDGNGTSFWKREKGRWVTGDWRPSRLMLFIKCDNLMLEDVTIQNSPSWTIHPIDCNRVTIRGISILNGIYEDDGPNTDGINPDGCTNVRISDCFIRTGDDSIVLKCTRGSNQICRNITVTNCVLITTETALKIGSESKGEFRNITFSNCTILDAGCGIGLWMRDGGLIDGWVINNISMTLTSPFLRGGQPIYIWSYRRTDDTPWGTVKNVTISNLTAVGDGCIFISGVPEKYIDGITLDNIRIFMRGKRETMWHTEPPFPFTVWGHHRAPYDIFCRYVNDLKIRNVQITWNSPEEAKWGSAIRCWHVKDLEIDGFVGRQSITSNAHAVWFKNVKGAFIHNCRAPEGTSTFLKVDDGTEHVTIMGNDFSRAKRMFLVEPGVDSKEVFEMGNRMPGNF